MNSRFLSVLLAILTSSMLSFSANEEEATTTKASKLTIGGRLQVQYQHIDANPDISRLFIRRARLTFQSKLTDWATLKLQFEAGNQKFTLKDAYLNFNLKWSDIFIGQKHVPFSREALTSSKYLQMVERSRTSEFAPFRQMGMEIYFPTLDKKLELSAGIYNGAVDNSSLADLGMNRLGKLKIYHIDTGASFDNNKFLYAGRIDFHPFGHMKKEQSYLEDLDRVHLSVGINFFSSDDSPREGHTLGVAELEKTLAYGADAALKFEGFAGTFEYLHRDLAWWNNFDEIYDAAQEALTLQGGFMIIPKKLELTTRYEYVKFDDNNVLLGPDGQNKDKWLTFGINYFFVDHYTKAQLNYILKNEEMPIGVSEAKNNTLLVQFAYYF